MDEYLIQRFHKRLRLQEPTQDEVSPYLGVNGLLSALHAERSARRRINDAQNPQAMADEASSSSSSSTAAYAAAANSGRTSFSVADVVQCQHGTGGRCLQCSGRTVQDVPLPLYSLYCNIFRSHWQGGTAGCPALSSTAARALSRELSLAAFASLVACLSPAPGERLLHLGSGTGRLTLCWSLFLPGSAACGVEGNSELHRAAMESWTRAPDEVRGRVFFHGTDIFSTQSEWHQGGVIVVNGASLRDEELLRVAEGLEQAEPGTRVVAVARPLNSNPDRPPLGFTLEKTAMYRTVGSTNATVYIYRKPMPEPVF